MADTQGWLTRTQAAQKLGLSGERIGQLAREGQLPHVVTPLGRLYDPTAVERLAIARASRRREPVPA